jgi:hypothetical protein
MKHLINIAAGNKVAQGIVLYQIKRPCYLRPFYLVSHFVLGYFTIELSELFKLW